MPMPMPYSYRTRTSVRGWRQYIGFSLGFSSSRKSFALLNGGLVDDAINFVVLSY